MRIATLIVLAALLMFGAACSQIGGVNIVPTTGDTASDPSAAQRFVPDFAGYTSVDTASITDALNRVGVGISVITLNPATAALIAQIDGMIACYRQVGAVAAKVYVDTNVSQLIDGQVPSVGALAVVNQDRAINNFLPCALGSGRGLSAQQQSLTMQPCGNSGTFTANGETLLYVYAATQQELCNLMQGAVTPR